ncbi:hypothetical protein LGN16_34980, partial [Burkholderia vietnamiensis]|nr:hypothetical protein [Burkholderia vietnamiensis]
SAMKRRSTVGANSLTIDRALNAPSAASTRFPDRAPRAKQPKTITDHRVDHAPNRIAYGCLPRFHGI